MATNLETPAKPKTISFSKVRVIVSVRPFLPQEIIASSKETLLPCASAHFDPTTTDDEVTIHLKDQKSSRHVCYNVDGFFGQEDNKLAQIFEKELKPLIAGVFRGCNATVFAYGATRSGKTYTMQGTDEQPGIMALAMSAVLSMCQTTGSIAELSYYEVYLENCYDLLGPKENEIQVLVDREGQIHLRGLSRVPVNSMPEFHVALARCIQRRKVAHTGLNDVSNRSHGVLVISVLTSSNAALQPTVIGKLNLVVLAGNEDNKLSGNEGIRMLESSNINQSLLALSNVIYALNNSKGTVPYRESKLTRMLQVSLGGCSRTLIVACLNPVDYQESIHIVGIAARMRQICDSVASVHKESTPKVRIDMEEKLRAWLESKQKERSRQKMGLLCFPFSPNTPRSVNFTKKQTVHQTSAQANAANGSATKHRYNSVHQRKLFYCETTSVSCKDSESLQDFEDVKNCHYSANDISVVPKDGRLNSFQHL